VSEELFRLFSIGYKLFSGFFHFLVDRCATRRLALKHRTAKHRTGLLRRHGATCGLRYKDQTGANTMLTTSHKAKRKGANVITINGLRGKIADIYVIGKNEWFSVEPDTGGAQAFLACELVVIR
jgi:hypothetical protein